PITTIPRGDGWRDEMKLQQIEIGQIEARTCHTGRHKSERRKFFRRDVTIEGPRVVMSIGTHERNGPMTAKVDLLTAAPDVMKAWTGAALAIAASLEPSLMELVKIRASQINGCANCIHMHAARTAWPAVPRSCQCRGWSPLPTRHEA